MTDLEGQRQQLDHRPFRQPGVQARFQRGRARRQRRLAQQPGAQQIQERAQHLAEYRGIRRRDGRFLAFQMVHQRRQVPAAARIRRPERALDPDVLQQIGEQPGQPGRFRHREVGIADVGGLVVDKAVGQHR